MRNPFNAKIVETIPLNPDAVDGIVFWSRDFGKMARQFDELGDIGYRFYFQNTITGYPKFLEPAVPSVDDACKTARKLAKSFGQSSVVWRYDPIVLTSLTDVGWHRENFLKLCHALEGATDTCVISFIDRYKKLERNFYPLLGKNDITYTDPAWIELEELATGLKEIAHKHGMQLTACCEPELDEEIAPPAKCIDVARFEKVWGLRLENLKTKPTRAGCCCVESKDIGAYNTCVSGCAYCYANQSQKNSVKNRGLIDTTSTSLCYF